MRMKTIKKVLCVVLSVFLLPITVYANEHTHIMVEDFKAPTCTEEGSYNYYCSICGYSPEGVRILPKTDHTVTEWITDKPAFCISHGKERGKCNNCGTLVYRSIPPNGKHLRQLVHAYPATTYSDGETLIKCSICNQTLKKTIIYRIKKLSLAHGCYEFSKKPRKPKVHAFDRKENEISADNFTVKYDKNTKTIGTHKVKIEFRNDYDAEAVLTYRVIPRKASVKKLTAQKNAAVIKLKKLPEEAEGYQVSYTTDKSFKDCKTLTVKSANQLTNRITGLKSKKKYYFRVRCCKTVKDKKYYSKWSEIKSIKTK